MGMKKTAANTVTIAKPELMRGAFSLAGMLTFCALAISGVIAN